jgi:hypothetical protein
MTAHENQTAITTNTNPKLEVAVRIGLSVSSSEIPTSLSFVLNQWLTMLNSPEGNRRLPDFVMVTASSEPGAGWKARLLRSQSVEYPYGGFETQAGSPSLAQ